LCGIAFLHFFENIEQFFVNGFTITQKMIAYFPHQKAIAYSPHQPTVI